MTESKLLTTEEAADYLRAYEDTLVYWRKVHRGPAYVRVGRRVMYAQVDLDKYIAENRRTGGGATDDTEDPPALPVAGRPDDH